MTSYERRRALRGIFPEDCEEVGRPFSRKIEPPFTEDERIQFTNVYRRQQRANLLALKVFGWVCIVVPIGGVLLFFLFLVLMTLNHA